MTHPTESVILYILRKLICEYNGGSTLPQDGALHNLLSHRIFGSSSINASYCGLTVVDGWPVGRTGSSLGTPEDPKMRRVWQLPRSVLSCSYV